MNNLYNGNKGPSHKMSSSRLGLTQRAPDGWDSPRFQAVRVAGGSSGKTVFSPPAHPQVTHTVRRVNASDYPREYKKK